MKSIILSKVQFKNLIELVAIGEKIVNEYRFPHLRSYRALAQYLFSNAKKFELNEDWIEDGIILNEEFEGYLQTEFIDKYLSSFRED